MQTSSSDSQTHVVPHAHAVTRQTPCVLWFTGLSASGKSTLANALESALFSLGHHTYLLDGNNIRKGLNRDRDMLRERGLIHADERPS